MPKLVEQQSNETRELLRIENLLKVHKLTMAGTPLKKYYAPVSRKTAETEADAIGFKGWMRRLFIKERQKGNVVGEQFGGSALQGNFLLEAFDALTFGVTGKLESITHTEQVQKTKLKANSQTGVTEAENQEGSQEKIEKAPSEAATWITNLLQGAGIRLLEIIGGGLLVLFGLYVLVKGESPHVGKVVSHAL